MNYVFYLTNRCNYDCDYCFQKDDHGNNDASIYDVDKFLNEVQEGSVVTLFGGEPFLNYKVLKYFIKRQRELKKNLFMNITTNGWYFYKDEHIADYLKTIKGTNVDTYISFDGKYNYHRKQGLTDTTKLTLKVLSKFSKLYEKGLVKYGISYTVREENFNDCIDDLREMLKYIKTSEIKINIDTKDLEEYGTLEEINDILRKRDFTDFPVPICPIFSKLCTKNCNSPDCEKGDKNSDRTTKSVFRGNVKYTNNIGDTEIFK